MSCRVPCFDWSPIFCLKASTVVIQKLPMLLIIKVASVFESWFMSYIWWRWSLDGPVPHINDVPIMCRWKWWGNDSSLLYDPTINHWAIIIDYLHIHICAVLFHRVVEWLLTLYSHVWWGFSLAQPCPLGFQRPTPSSHEGFNGSLFAIWWSDFLNYGTGP